jgi:hypothetical protein
VETWSLGLLLRTLFSEGAKFKAGHIKISMKLKGRLKVVREGKRSGIDTTGKFFKDPVWGDLKFLRGQW